MIFHLKVAHSVSFFPLTLGKIPISINNTYTNAKRISGNRNASKYTNTLEHFRYKISNQRIVVNSVRDVQRMVLISELSSFRCIDLCDVSMYVIRCVSTTDWIDSRPHLTVICRLVMLRSWSNLCIV